MAKLLAIEWDAREARIAVAQPRGKEVLLEDAFAVDLTADTDSPDEQAAERIAAALAARNIGRAEALVAVGRANIELRQMTMPPAPPEELPEMVRFQAQRQFTTITPEWLLDFVPLPAEEGESPTVIAAAISPDIVSQIRKTCETCELTPKRLVLRPFAAASLLRRHDRGSHQPPRIMVDLLADEADLTVLVDEQVVLMRTVRLPSGSSDAENLESPQNKSLLGEIRRTIAAAQNQMGGKRVEKVIVCGDGSDQKSLCQYIEQQLSYTVETFDPFQQARQKRELIRPEHAGRFTPLIGMLTDELEGASHALDFLHPRRRPEPPSNRRRNVLIGATAAAAALAISAIIWLQLTEKDNQLALLNIKSNGLKSKVTEAQKHRDDLALIRDFQDSDILWLDELYELCETVPPSQDILVSRVVLGVREPKGGSLQITGYARDSGLIENLRNALSRGGREVVPGGSRFDERHNDYQWQFSETALIEPRSESEGDVESVDPQSTDTTTEDTDE